MDIVGPLRKIALSKKKRILKIGSHYIRSTHKKTYVGMVCLIKNGNDSVLIKHVKIFQTLHNVQFILFNV